MVETTSCLRAPGSVRHTSGVGGAGVGLGVALAMAVSVTGAPVWVGIISFDG